MAPEVKEQILISNAAISRLAQRRRSEIEIVGHLARSRISWKIETFVEAVIYRLVSLGHGAALNWNSGNALPAFLCSRAAVETCALLFEFQQNLIVLLEKEDLGAIDDLVMNRMFSSRDAEWVKESPTLSAINVLTFINKFNDKVSGIRSYYDRLSERCHPNSFGHHQLFTRTDHDTGVVTFDATKAKDDIRAVTVGMTLIAYTEGTIDEIHDTNVRIADLHHRLQPVTD
jgi:hypothetical protein